MTKRTLTGNYRFRQSRTGYIFKNPMLILQFEYHTTGFVMDNCGGVVDSRDVDYISWEDATIESLQEFNKKFKGKL